MALCIIARAVPPLQRRRVLSLAPTPTLQSFLLSTSAAVTPSTLPAAVASAAAVANTDALLFPKEQQVQQVQLRRKSISSAAAAYGKRRRRGTYVAPSAGRRRRPASGRTVPANATPAVIAPPAPSRTGSSSATSDRQRRRDANPHKFRTPTLEVAQSMPLSCREMDNTALLCLAALDVREARAEVLRRHIMCADRVDYRKAGETFAEISAFNRRGLLLHTVPYKFGIGAATLAATVSIPLCFHLPSVAYFNERFVTADVPEPKDLETWLEVGSWAWNWMEPPLGQISFMLLCMQFARNRLTNIGLKPYGTIIKQKRADRLVRAYPQYDAQILSDYSKSVSYY